MSVRPSVSPHLTDTTDQLVAREKFYSDQASGRHVQTSTLLQSTRPTQLQLPLLTFRGKASPGQTWQPRMMEKGKITQVLTFPSRNLTLQRSGDYHGDLTFQYLPTTWSVWPGH